MAERRRQAGLGGRGTHTQTHKHMDRDVHAETYGNICMGIYAYRQSTKTDEIACQHSDCTVILLDSSAKCEQKYLKLFHQPYTHTSTHTERDLILIKSLMCLNKKTCTFSSMN